MKKHTMAAAVFVLLAVLAVAQSLSFLVGPGDPLNPGEGGTAGESTVLLIVQLFTITVLVVTFLGASMAMPRIADWALSIPNKEYWLGPERRQETMDYVVRWLLWFGSLNLLLMLMIFRQAHLSRLGQADPAGMWVVMAAYVAGSIVFTVRLLIRFSVPPAPGSSPP